MEVDPTGALLEADAYTVSGGIRGYGGKDSCQ